MLRFETDLLTMLNGANLAYIAKYPIESPNVEMIGSSRLLDHGLEQRFRQAISFRYNRHNIVSLIGTRLQATRGDGLFNNYENEQTLLSCNTHFDIGTFFDWHQSFSELTETMIDSHSFGASIPGIRVWRLLTRSNSLWTKNWQERIIFCYYFSIYGLRREEFVRLMFLAQGFCQLRRLLCAQ